MSTTTILTSQADYGNATSICVINDIEGRPERKCMAEARIWHNETPTQVAEKLTHLAQSVEQFDAVRADADAAQRGDMVAHIGAQPNIERPGRHMTGLRRVILDAIKGAPVPDMATCDRLTKTGQMEYLGDQHRWVWGWKAEFLESSSTDDLLAMYDTLRPGVLEAMGSGQ